MRYLKLCWNFENFKYVFLGERGFWFWSLQNDCIYDFLLFLKGWRQLEAKKCHFSKILTSENVTFNFLKFCQWKFFAKNGSKGLVTPNIKKSLPFEPQKIAFKMIYWQFSLGVLNTSPFSNRVKPDFVFGNSSSIEESNFLTFTFNDVKSYSCLCLIC